MAKKRFIFKRLFGKFRPENNAPVGIYGPPSMLGGFSPEENEPVDVYGPPPGEDAAPPEFDPAENENLCVYGPPEMMGGEGDGSDG